MKKNIYLTQKSGTYNYKLIIPAEVERKIRFTCQKVWNTEWSGTLFFTHEGSFENNDLVIRCVDIYIMDIGNATYTEFDMSPDVIAYMTEHPELLDCQMGLIHSHNNMSTFFSQTDTATLKEEGIDRNNFVSLIVNNAGTYTAAITRRIKSKSTKESTTFEFFGEGERNDTKEFHSNVDEIEWFYLNIEKEGESYSFNDLNNRLEELEKQKKERVKNPICTYNTCPTQKSLFEDTCSVNINDVDDEPEYESIPYDEVSVDENIIKHLIKQLITCSIIIPEDSKIDINKWANNMKNVYERRFGKGEEGLKRFRDWASYYVEFLTWIEDKALLEKGFRMLDIQSICANDLIKALSKLPKNEYIKIFINELKRLTV